MKGEGAGNTSISAVFGFKDPAIATRRAVSIDKPVLLL